jgi:hypothetical protein
VKSSVDVHANARERLAELMHPDPHTAARALGSIGLSVFPIHSVDRDGRCSCGKQSCPDIGKHPRTPNGLRDATRDAGRIRDWWTSWPEANVAVATGGASGVWALDIDPAKGGLENLEQLAAAHGKLPRTWVVETGGRGLHAWFASNNTTLRNSVGRIAPGLDVRAEGGYVIVPPSRHESGLAYRWPGEWHPTRIDLTPAPQWLVDLAREASAPKMIPPVRSPIEGGVGGNHLRVSPAVLSEGQRNSALASMAGSMRQKGFGEAAIIAALLAENTDRCRPPLSESEVAKIARSIARYAPPLASGLPHPRPRTNAYVEFVGGKAVAR